MSAPRFAKASPGALPWRPSFASVARHALLFGVFGGAVLVSVFFKFATLGLEPSRLAQTPCPPAAEVLPLGENMTLVNVSDIQHMVEQQYQQRLQKHQDALSVLTQRDRDMDTTRNDMHAWLHLLRMSSAKKPVASERTSCRELTAKGQTCVFEGLICINTSSALPSTKRPLVYIIDDRKGDIEEEAINHDGNVGLRVPTDDWCGYRSQAADPRYYSSRHWPLMNGTIVPQQSCMDAWYRTSKSVFGGLGGTAADGMKHVKWIPNLALFDLDYQENTHNTHLAMDILWALDARLYQQSLDIHPRPGYRTLRAPHDHDTTLLAPDTVYYMPQSRAQFLQQTAHDINRLMYAITLDQDPRKLYGEDDDMKTPPKGDDRRYTRQTFLDSFPALNETGMRFHGDLLQDDAVELVCSARVTTGFKTGFTADERVCRHVRTKAYELYGIERPEKKHVGSLFYPQPPKSVLILNRHVSRKLGNWEQVQKGLTERLAPLGVNVSYTDSGMVYTAEEWVRVFASAGVIITPHGGHNMGVMFMQRYSALIEIMPVGYTEHSFNLLSEPCKVWYYEVPSLALKSNIDRYTKECGSKTPHMYSPCNQLKSEDVWGSVDKLHETVLMALERLGYDTGTWMNNFHKDNKTKVDLKVKEAEGKTDDNRTAVESAKGVESGTGEESR